jgi:hypothetical protein
LKSLGALPIHRRSFARVRQALGLDPVQTELFASEEEHHPHLNNHFNLDGFSGIQEEAEV